MLFTNLKLGKDEAQFKLSNSSKDFGYNSQTSSNNSLLTSVSGLATAFTKLETLEVTNCCVKALYNPEKV